MCDRRPARHDSILHHRLVDAFIDAAIDFSRGGALIPQRNIVFAALAESPGAYAVHDQPWASRWEGIDLTPRGVLP